MSPERRLINWIVWLIGQAQPHLSSGRLPPFSYEGIILQRRIELLAPGGDVDAIKAAIIAGANAIYCGLDKFNARYRAANISFEELNGILRLAHSHECQVFLTLNIMIVESDLPKLIGLLNKLINTKIDGVIVQDLGLFYLLAKYFTGLKIHASTQLTTHNVGQIKFLSKLTAIRANLSRELNIDEIRALTLTCHEEGISTEVFVHGSYCISFSGICYLSSVHGANSGNRGRCSQPCRDRYLTTPEGKDFPLNMKDNSAYFDLKILFEAGIDSIKIEGRMKKSPYVYTVTRAWRNLLQSLYDNDKLVNDSSDLHKVFNRDFSNSYLIGDIDKYMFSDHPLNHSAQHLRERNYNSAQTTENKAPEEPYDEIDENISHVEKIIERVSIAKAPLIMSISGKLGTPLKVTVKTPDASFEVVSEGYLAPSGRERHAQQLTREMFLAKLNAINATEYFIEQLDLENLQLDLFVPFKEIVLIKKKILFILNGSKEIIEPIDVPVLNCKNNARIVPTLAVLISSPNDLPLGQETRAEIHLQLPSRLKSDSEQLVELLAQYPEVIPWFPSILIGEDYSDAVNFLRQVRPKRIVTNNTGIAFEAYSEGIPWISGPYLNLANSFSLLCLKDNFNCYGSFVSNELSQRQIKAIQPPDDFKLYYCIYHPIVLLTSRQCLFHQVTGCEKNSIDEMCLSQCEKSSSIKNSKDVTLYIKKEKGHYASIYHETHFLNVDIVTDVPNFFSGFLIDLRNIETETEVGLDKTKIIQLFGKYLKGNADSIQLLKQSIQPTTMTQYVRGI